TSPFFSVSISWNQFGSGTGALADGALADGAVADGPGAGGVAGSAGAGAAAGGLWAGAGGRLAGHPWVGGVWAATGKASAAAATKRTGRRRRGIGSRFRILRGCSYRRAGGACQRPPCGAMLRRNRAKSVARPPVGSRDTAHADIVAGRRPHRRAARTC